MAIAFVAVISTFLTTSFFISNIIINNARLQLAKNQANGKRHPVAKLWLFENYSHSSSPLSSKNNRTYSKNKQKNKCVCIHEIIQLIIMKMKMKEKNRSHRYDINGPRFRHEQKYSKYKMRLSMIIIICIKQPLSNVSSSIHENVKQH